MIRWIALAFGCLAVLLSCLSLAAAASAAETEVTIEPGAGFTTQQEREIRRLVAESEIPVVVRALETLPASAAGSATVHAEQVATQLLPSEGDGVVVVFSADSLPTRGAFESREESTLGAAKVAVKNTEGDEHVKFVRLVDLLVHGNGIEVLEEQTAALFTDDAGGRTGDSASTLVVVGRWLVVAVAVAAVGALVWFRGRAILAWWRRRRRAEGLERAASQAKQVNLADRAKADLLAFGAEIDAESMDEHDSLDLWQLALDDYHEASTLFDRRHGPEDDEQIIAACERGRDRLARAQRTPPNEK